MVERYEFASNTAEHVDGVWKLFWNPVHPTSKRERLVRTVGDDVQRRLGHGNLLLPGLTVTEEQIEVVIGEQ